MDANTLNNAAKVCPACGKPVKPGAKFCIGCGTKLEQAPAAPAAFAPVEEPAPADNAFAPVDAAPANDAFAPAEEPAEAFDPYASEAPVAFGAPEEAAPAFGSPEEAAPSAFGTISEAAAEAPVKEEPAVDAFPTFDEVSKADTDKKSNDDAPAFGSFDAKPEKAAKVVVEEKYEEPDSVFAQGLPEWSVEPPLTAVKRRRH